jgi:heterogeneous nuclear ribonucleoprotein U-like protein 1
LQQANVYGSAQKRKTRNFYGFHRKAVVLVPMDEEFKARIAKRKEEPDGEEIRESSILEVKGLFNLTFSLFFDVKGLLL